MLKVSDLVSGLAFAGLGLTVFLQAQTFPMIGASPISPSFYPGLIGLVLMGCGAVLAVKDLVRRTAFPLAALPDWVKRRENIVAVISVPAAIVGYGLLSMELGFIATSTIITCGLLLAFRVNLIWSLVVAVGLSIALHIIFVVMMRVPLPPGFIEAMLR